MNIANWRHKVGSYIKEVRKKKELRGNLGFLVYSPLNSGAVKRRSTLGGRRVYFGVYCACGTPW